MRMRLEMGLEMRLEQRQELVLVQALIQEWSDFISLDFDSDWELLHESLPFIMLHELGHAFHIERNLTVPRVEIELPLDYEHIHTIDHDSTEIGIDRGAILIGAASTDYSFEDIAYSHTALIQRVFRDCLREPVIRPSFGFIARCEAQHIHYESCIKNENTLRRVKELRKDVEGYKCRLQKDSRPIFEDVVDAYTQVYKNTELKHKNYFP
jgi:hypothetical protein